MSLERKIILSFLISAALIAVLAGTAAVNLLEIRRGIARLELSDTLRSKTLLVRRHEKNYFLYGELKDREQLHAHLEELAALVRAQPSRPGVAGLAELGRRLEDYRASFRRIESLAEQLRKSFREIAPRHPRLIPTLPLLEAVLLERPFLDADLLARSLPAREAAPLGATLTALDTEIAALRRSGEDLLTVTANLDRDARVRAERALRRFRDAALVLFPLSLLVGLGSLFAIGRSVVRRLKLLTRVIEQTGKGDFSAPELPAGHDEVGILVGAVATMERELAARDREIVAKNEELLQGRKLAAIGTLASGVAHELNNPLNNISLAAQILARQLSADGSSPLVKDTLADILSQTQRVKRIVWDLLEFAREKPPELRPADLVAIIREAAERAVPPGSPVTFRLEAPATAPILADHHKLTQVFVNLIANAVEALGGTGAVTVTVTSAGGRVQAAVADTGRGIHPDDLPKIFDPFYSTKESGTGLGLAIVYNTVRTHGGSVEVESRLEKGTTFTVTLPGMP